jgi:hypothetical protein
MSAKPDKAKNSCEHISHGYDLGLAERKTQKRVPGVDADKFYTKTFDTIQQGKKPKEKARGFQPAAQGPQDKEKQDAEDGLVEGSRVDRRRQPGAIIIWVRTHRDGDPLTKHVVGKGGGP